MAETTPGIRVPGPWYHGSPEELAVLRIGSTITQDRALAAAFSHKPSLLVQDDGRIRHNGQRPGFLFAIAEPVNSDDIVLVPGSTMGSGQEWLTRRPLRLTLLERLVPSPAAMLSEADVAAGRQRLAGQQRARATER